MTAITAAGAQGRRYGYSLLCEGTPPKELVRQAVRAEEAGFDFLTISDHIHPWLYSQQHSGYAWSILGAIAQATERIELVSMVTCPIVRYHPVLVAQMAATTAILSDGRFTLGLGAGERLNEHVVGRGWPAVDVRHEMLREAIEIMARLWAGGYVTYRGAHFAAEDVRIFDLPDTPVPVFVAASGPRAARLAAEVGAGFCNTEPTGEVVAAYAAAGGRADAIWGQLVLAWAGDEQTGLEEAHEVFRFAAGGWKVQAELPNPVNIEAATEQVTPADMGELLPAGPDADRHAEAIGAFHGAGVGHLALAYPGDDLDGFLAFWAQTLGPALGVAPPA